MIVIKKKYDSNFYKLTDNVGNDKILKVPNNCEFYRCAIKTGVL